MARPAGSFLTTTFAYINAQVPPGGIGGKLAHRNLDAYYEAKKNENSPTGGDPSRQSVKQMANRAAQACGLAGHHAPYAPPNDREQAAAAVVLALSIIKDTQQADLAGHWNRLRRQPPNATLRELKTLLQTGDVERSQKNARMEMKNFGSAGLQKKRYMEDAEEAYEKAYNLMMSCRQGFIKADNPSQRIMAAFNTYFGAPATPIVTAGLPWIGAAPPALPAGANVSAVRVAKSVLHAVVEVFLTATSVRLYFGGKAIDPGTYAYVSGVTDPAKIHFGGQFFRAPKRGRDTQAGTIIHEMTHTFARTDDHAYGHGGATGLVMGGNIAQALTNADNYQLFVETAFG